MKVLLLKRKEIESLISMKEVLDIVEFLRISSASSNKYFIVIIFFLKNHLRII
jgi:hypothetical protein